MASQNKKQIITKLLPDDLKMLQQQLGQNLLVVKFGANWCGPCKKIKPIYEEWLLHVAPNILVADLDIDATGELYAALKAKKMVNGVPTFLAFYGDAILKDDFQWFIPSDSNSGSDGENLKRFFNRCTSKGLEMMQTI